MEEMVSRHLQQKKEWQLKLFDTGNSRLQRQALKSAEAIPSPENYHSWATMDTKNDVPVEELIQKIVEVGAVNDLVGPLPKKPQMPKPLKTRHGKAQVKLKTLERQTYEAQVEWRDAEKEMGLFLSSVARYEDIKKVRRHMTKTPAVAQRVKKLVEEHNEAASIVASLTELPQSPDNGDKKDGTPDDPGTPKPKRRVRRRKKKVGVALESPASASDYSPPKKASHVEEENSEEALRIRLANLTADE